VIEKDERLKRKNWLKKHVLLCLFENLEGSKVLYNKLQDTWNITIQVAYPIPKELELVKLSMEEDLKQEEMQKFLTQQEERLNNKLKEYFEVAMNPVVRETDTNLTMLFPPTLITVRDGKYWRLRTKEEEERLINECPSLADVMKREFEMVEEGYFEFKPETPIANYEIEAFRLKKYASLRARYSFIIPNSKVKEINPDILEPIFPATKQVSA